MRPSFFAEEIHGKSGLDGFDAENGALILDAANFTIPQNPKKMSTKKKALFAMHDAINTRIQRQPNQPVYVVCTAALTNMALFLSVYPELIPKIRVGLVRREKNDFGCGCSRWSAWVVRQGWAITEGSPSLTLCQIRRPQGWFLRVVCI